MAARNYSDRSPVTHRNKRFLLDTSREGDIPKGDFPKGDFPNGLLPAKRLHLEPRLKTGSYQVNDSGEVRTLSTHRTTSVGNVSPEEFIQKMHSNSNTTSEAKDDTNTSLLVLNLSYRADTSLACCSSNASLASDELNKENSEDAHGLPMDLSKGSKRSLGVDSGAGNSEHKEEQRIGEIVGGIFRSVDDRTFSRLREELRQEESKLVLMKKILLNQQMFHAVRDLSDACRSSPLPVPPPLIRGGGRERSGHRGGDASAPPLTSHRHPHSHAPPALVASSCRQSTGVVIPTLKSVHGGVLPSAVRGHNAPSSQVPPVPSLVQPPRAPPAQQPAPGPLQEQTAGQRQVSAKVALRKQLEKTLLQIPPPKPPAPEMNFIPSVGGSADFAALLGLEEAVKCIVDSDACERGEPVSEVAYVFSPFRCVQCRTDFTPVWKRDSPGSRSIICERCVTSNQKRALKLEHTNRLKSAFVKALQQEQEIDRTLLLAPASGPASPRRPTPVPSPQSHPRMSSSPTSRLPPSCSQEQPKRPSSGLWTPPMLASMGGLSPAFSPHLLFPFPRLPVTTKSAIDLQRQYMLDLMPKRIHLDGSSTLWQT